MANLTDLALIKDIKENCDSAALTELVSRHTGLYATIVNQYAAYSANVNKADMIDDRLYNIWEYAKDFKPECGMKFSTYLGERIKYACKTACKTTLSKKARVGEDISATLADGHDIIAGLEARDDVDQIKSNTLKRRDAMFRRILKMRSEDKKLAWTKVGKALGVSHEWARKLYYRRLKELKNKVLS